MRVISKFDSKLWAAIDNVSDVTWMRETLERINDEFLRSPNQAGSSASFSAKQSLQLIRSRPELRKIIKATVGMLVQGGSSGACGNVAGQPALLEVLEQECGQQCVEMLLRNSESGSLKVGVDGRKRRKTGCDAENVAFNHTNQ
jgi:hypothetical protein